MGFLLKVIFIIFAIFWLSRLLFAFLFKRFIGTVQKKAEELQKQQYEFYRQQQEQYRQQYEEEPAVGEVKVQTKTKQQKTFEDNTGDYIDFEEVGD